MTEASSTTDSRPRRVLGILLAPLSLFPLVALVTYDWRAVPELCSPPLPRSNWIGALGDGFAYWGYMLVGLAVWIVPLLCLVASLRMVRGRTSFSWRRALCLVAFICAAACAVQVVGAHGGIVEALRERVNTPQAGGAVGYLVMTRALSPLLSDFGSSVVAILAMVAALIGAVGLRAIGCVFAAMWRWVRAGAASAPPPPSADDSAAGIAAREAYIAALKAREEVRRQREEEKERIRQEKLAAKEAKRAEKEAARQAKEAARNAPPPVAPQPQPAAPQRDAADPEATAEKQPYSLPPVSLLSPLRQSKADHSDVGEMSRRLIDTLKLFNIDAELDDTVQGPVVTKYKISLAPGTRYSAVTSLADNIKGALHAKSLRIEAPIPGEECIGIEVPNRAPAGISFREIFESDAWKKADAELPLLFGKRADGRELVADLASMPHMLVAGATGQGKSVCLNSLIGGLLMTRTPEQLKLIMVDPKSVEFTAYAAIPHLIVPVITENKQVVFSLRWAVSEMEKRLKLFARARVRNIYDFNHRQSLSQMEMFGDDTAIGADMPKTVPYIVIIIDEVADLMASSGKEVSPDIARLTAKARAAGIHLILATQRPDAKIITGTIKANIPGRIAFKTATSIDSRTILDDTGAENLIGRGDMLFKSKDGLLIRAQGAWISDQEIANVTRYIEEHSSTEFDDRFTNKLSTIKEEEVDIFADETGGSDTGKDAAAAAKEQVKAEENASDFKKAIECIINTNRASTSHFQRKLGWGYNHSAKIMDMLEDAGIIAPQSGAGPRQIIMDQDQLLAVFNGGRDEAFAAPGGEDGDNGGAEQDFNEEEQQ